MPVNYDIEYPKLQNVVSAQEQIIKQLSNQINKLNSEKTRVKATNERWRSKYAKVKAQRDKLAVQIALGDYCEVDD